MSTLSVKQISNKRTTKENTTKSNKKKTLKNKKIPTLRFDNDDEIPAKTAYMKDSTKCFKISDIDINKIRLSEGRLYNKKHNSYKYYVFYEHDNEYIPLRIILKDVVGYYNDYKDYKDYSKYSAKKMNFKLDDDSLDKVYDIFVHIEEKSGIDLSNYIYESKDE